MLTVQQILTKLAFKILATDNSIGFLTVTDKQAITNATDQIRLAQRTEGNRTMSDTIHYEDKSNKPSHYPFRYEEHNAKAFVPTGRLVTADGQILVDGILSADFGYRLEKCVNFCEGIASSDLEENTFANMRRGFRKPLASARKES